MELAVKIMGKLSKDPDTGMFWKCALKQFKKCIPASSLIETHNYHAKIVESLDLDFAFIHHAGSM
jgi:cephalosporin-C deacetylase-like acetyl esterase